MDAISKLLKKGSISWNSLKSKLEGEKVDDATKNRIQSIFNSVDANRDGKITQDEWDKAFEKDMKAADTNRDGELSNKEIHDADDSNIHKNLKVSKVQDTLISGINKLQQTENTEATNTETPENPSTPIETTDVAGETETVKENTVTNDEIENNDMPIDSDIEDDSGEIDTADISQNDEEQADNPDIVDNEDEEYDDEVEDNPDTDNSKTEPKVGDTQIAGKDDLIKAMQESNKVEQQQVVGGIHTKVEADSNGHFEANAQGFVNVSDNTTIYGSVQHKNGQVARSQGIGLPNSGTNPLDNKQIDTHQNNVYRNAALEGSGYGQGETTTNLGAGVVSGNEHLTYGATANATLNDGEVTNLQAGGGVEYNRNTENGHFQSIGADVALRRNITDNSTTFNANLNLNQQYTNGTEVYTNLGYNKTSGGSNTGETYYAQGGIRKSIGRKFTAFGNAQISTGTSTGGAADIGIEVGGSYKVGPGHVFAKYGTGMGKTNADFKMGSIFEIGYSMNLDKLTGKTKRNKK